MAIDRGRESFQFNKLISCVAVSYCVLATRCTLQISACLDQPPTSVVTYLDEYATFRCSIREGDILWYVNDTYVVGLPPEYGASFMPGSSTANCIQSTLQILAIEQTNDSQIQCAVGINGRLNRYYFPSTALLQVQGPPLPPANLQGSINTDVLTIELVWEEPSSLINNSISNYTIHINISLETSEYIIYEDITNATLLEYNVSNDGIHFCNISWTSVTVNVYAHNKAGVGEPAEKIILPNLFEHCVSSSVSSMALTMTSSSVPSLVPRLKDEPPSTNKKRIYGAVGGVLAVLILLMTVTVTVTTVHLLRSQIKRARTNNEPKIHVTSNEAYESVQRQETDDIHIYEELTTHNQVKIEVTTNEAYVCTHHSNHQTY